MPNSISFKTLAVAAALAVAPLAWASQAPYPQSFGVSTQKQVASLSQWSVVADDLVATLAGALGDAGLETPLYFEPKTGSDAWTARLQPQMREFMMDSAVKRGFTVLTHPRPDAIVVDASAFLSVRRSEVETVALPYTMLTAGVLVLREVALQHWMAGALGAALLGDITNSVKKQPPRGEFAVTLAAHKDGKYLWRKSSVYFVDHRDVVQPGKTFRVESVR